MREHKRSARVSWNPNMGPVQLDDPACRRSMRNLRNDGSGKGRGRVGEGSRKGRGRVEEGSGRTERCEEERREEGEGRVWGGVWGG